MRLFLKSACVLCGDLADKTISLCEPCRKDLPILENACQQCGLPLEPADEQNKTCGQCLASPPAVDYTLCLYHYQQPLDYLITELKFNQKLSHAAIFSSLIISKLRHRQVDSFFPDCLLPVPLHKSRLIKRGFNQSLEIAKPIAKHFKLPVETRLVKRNRQTLAQTELNAKQRKKNVRGCFELKDIQTKNMYQHVVIIDDVVTTGSTINELATLLKKHGVKTVGVWAAARAVINKLNSCF